MDLEREVEERLALMSQNARLNEYGFDKWGYSPEHVKKSAKLWAWMYRHYWRVETHGIENVPPGRGLLIGNHSSQLAYDGVMVAMAMLLEAEPPRGVRAMIEKFFQLQPFVNVMMARSGQLTGLPENCERLLAEEHLIMVFPEGARGGGKTVWERYQLQQFGQGFMRLALKTRAPIIPFGFIGGEEVCPALVNLKPVARLLGMPYLPITPTLLPLPLPAKCSIYFGEPLRFEGTGTEEDGEVLEKIEAVKASVASLIERGRAERKGVFL
ncbi:MAG TPA: lysophospholipid acyltransferase family protein [Polyangiaceae bacterium]|jgi:1-acyl-sn-glycerol-3-phosphate acyltransferase|nr:lysophospholipid acyltransferase family protein [Polyangiaceae bacterium]